MVLLWLLVPLKMTTQRREKKGRPIIIPMKYATHALYTSCLSMSLAYVFVPVNGIAHNIPKCLFHIFLIGLLLFQIKMLSVCGL